MSERAIPPAEPTIISLRAYAEPPAKAPRPGGDDEKRKARPIAPPSDWTVIFDTETTADECHAFRYGAYQVRHRAAPHEAGLFYDPGALTEAELAVLTRYAGGHGLTLRTHEDFVTRIFYGYGYDLRATIVGFNLPFDLSRIAIGHGSARGDMRGGFTFKLTDDKRRPNVQVRHISGRKALIRFAAPYRQRKARSQRRRQDHVPTRRGFFVDVGTLAGALYSRPFTLDSLGRFLGVEHPKLSIEEFGGAVTNEDLDYAARDPLTTWECFAELRDRYEALGLAETPAHLIYSEASIGKAYFKAMGIKPWREVQTDCPPDMLAAIMATYFGGRSEVRIRRELRQVVLCDFLSMYPTVCTLLNLWPFVIGRGMRWRDGTAEVQAFLNGLTIDQLKSPATWRTLTALVQVQPDADMKPVRAPFADQAQATIGLSYLSSDRPLWFTLADCAASTILNGHPPKVLSAWIFEPGDPQDDLRMIAVGGDDDYRVDPATDSFFKRLIELRQQVKGVREGAIGEARDRLEAQQNSLKLAANATSYGIFVEVNVNERAADAAVTVHSADGESYEVTTSTIEEPGRYFHPLLATLITGAARLMLAITERLVIDAGLEWAFCDTDSMAIARPETMDEVEFHARVDSIVTWFADLNPYAFGGSILKVEPENFSPADGKRAEPLYVWAISAKRYVLFNIGPDGKPIIRKASAHGLGHLRAPYDKASPAPAIPPPSVGYDDVSKLGVELWQHDIWWTIASAALAGHPDQVALDYHPALHRPAVSRYAVTTPRIERWYKPFNRNRPYARRVRPFGFLLSLFADPNYEDEPFGRVVQDSAPGRPRIRRAYKPVAPFDRDHLKAASAAFDRETGAPVPRGALKSVAEALIHYHLHPEAKFHNGDYFDRGVTRRRHILATGVRLIGKEANRWEEQYYTGPDADAAIEYGSPPADLEAKVAALRLAAKAHGVPAIARQAGMPAHRARRVVKVGPLADVREIGALCAAVERMDREAAERAQAEGEQLAWACDRIAIEGLRPFARRVGMDHRNLAAVLAGRRPLSASAIVALRVAAGRT